MFINKYDILMWFILSTQFLICSQAPNKSTIHDQIVAMLLNRIPLDITGTTSTSGKQIYPTTPTHNLLITGDCLPNMQSTRREELLLGKGKCQYATPCLTKEEAQTAIAQGNISDHQQQLNLLQFLTTGIVQQPDSQDLQWTLSTESGALELTCIEQRPTKHPSKPNPDNLQHKQ